MGASAVSHRACGPKPDGLKAHSHSRTGIVRCMHQQRFIPSVIGPVQNCTNAKKCAKRKDRAFVFLRTQSAKYALHCAQYTIKDCALD